MVFVIATMGMTLTFNYQDQGQKYHTVIEKGSFWHIIMKCQVS